MSIGPGDLVVCVDAVPCPYYGGNPLVEGRIYRVTQVINKPGRSKRYGPGNCALHLAGVRSSAPNGFDFRRFRKLNDESDNTELIERIRKCKPLKIHERS